MNLLFGAIDIALNVLQIAILVKVLSSWLPMSKENKLFEYLDMITEPFLAPIRNLLSKSSFFQSNMGMDFSPIIAFLIIAVVKSIIRGFI